MRYMMLLYRNEQTWAARTEEDRAKGVAAHQPYIAMLKAQGHYLGSDLLALTGSATTLRTEGGKLVTTDGPFAETREQLGGYYLLEAKDLDEVMKIAAQMPGRERVTIEIRPVVPT
jgi:hypothetical protein